MTREKDADDQGRLERERIAGELHDALSQLTFSVAIELDWCLHKLGATDPIRSKLERIRWEIGSMMAHIRGLITNLTQDEGPTRTVDEKLRALIEPFRELTGVDLDFSQDPSVEVGLDLLLDRAAQKILYNAIQEALANIAKHAHSKRVYVALGSQDGQVRFEVSDDGAGLSTRDLRRRGHFGLRQMRQRIEAAGGWLDLRSRTPTGLRVVGALPIKKQAEKESGTTSPGIGL